MSEFWNKFKGVFIVDDPNQPQQTPNQNPATPKGADNNNQSSPSQNQSLRTDSQSNSASTMTPNSTQSSGKGSLNEKFMEVLYKAMESVNVEGFDYFEFKQALNNLANMPMDEATRYKSAFAMAQTMGATPDKLVHTANGYLEALKQEQMNFQQSATNQIQSQIGNKQGQIENFAAVINQKNEQIKKLLGEIEDHKKEMEQLKQDIAQSSSKVSQTKADFEMSYQSIVSQIQKDIDNMKSYLK